VIVAGLVLGLVSLHSAILIGLSDDASVRSDLSLMSEGLIRRGWNRSEIRALANPSADSIDEELRSFANSARGTALIYVSGPGDVDRKNLVPSAATGLPWSAILAPMGAAPSVHFDLIADASFTNLLYGAIPPNVSFLGLAGSWRDVTQRRAVGLMIHSGHPIEAGVMTYVLARELPYASTLANLADRVSQYKQSGSMGAIWFNAPVCQVLGKDWELPGKPDVWHVR
jgi:hypothetical protein